MKNIFNAQDAQSYIDRINQLNARSERRWGKMTVDQMLAHCNITYSMIFEPEKHKKPGFIARFILKKFVKSKVCNDIAYKTNLPTSPAFVISDEKVFDEEQKKLFRVFVKNFNAIFNKNRNFDSDLVISEDSDILSLDEIETAIAKLRELGVDEDSIKRIYFSNIVPKKDVNHIL